MTVEASMQERGGRDNPIILALKNIDDSNIDYVIWKNGQEIAAALHGGGDIDVFIPRRFKSSVVEQLRGCGWVRLVEASISFPNVEHFYYVGDNGTLCHLNAYFQVVTGESWLKEFILPLDTFLIKNRVKGEYDIWILSFEAQSYIFYLRHVLKNGSCLSRLVYAREFFDYQQEWARCYQDKQESYGPDGAKLGSQLRKAGLSADGLVKPSWWTAMKARWSYYPCLRFPLTGLVFVRYWYLLRKIVYRKIWYRKKESVGDGMICALSGADGAGKSTMLAHLHETYSQFMTVKIVHLGRPQGRIIEFARKLFSNNATGDDRPRVSTVAPANASLKRTIATSVLALLRLWEAKKAQRWAKKGYLVLSDRWPTTQAGLMDGPKLKPEGDLSTVQRVLWSAVDRMYALMPHADVCIILEVDTEHAINRNRSRIKKDKETDDEILSVHEANVGHTPLSDQVIRFDNNDDLESASARLTALLWRCIARHAA